MLTGSRTLRQVITERLGGYAFPPDMASLRVDLATVRKLITGSTDFSPTQQAAILSALVQAGFDPERKIRFRSSTNVEDTDQFTGAGLYDSHSGCLADDLDADSLGPCHCEPGEPGERGIFRALRRVYAKAMKEILERNSEAVREAGQQLVEIGVKLAAGKIHDALARLDVAPQAYLE